MKKIHTVVAVVGITAAGLAAWWWQRPTPPAATDATASARPSGGQPGGGSGAQGAPGAPGAAGAAGGPGGRGPGGAPGGGGGPAPVEVARAESITITDDVQAVGSLRARQGVMIRPEASGRIARLGFTDGQRVKKGQLLVQLDDTLQQAQLEQARAQASIARTNLARSRELLAQNFVSQSAVDQNAANLQVAEAQVALAQAQLARMKVLAPFDGTAGLKLVEVGDYVKDGADVVNLEDLSALEVEFALPERYVGRARPGQPVEVLLDALPGQAVKGELVALNSLVDANGRSLLVRARVSNPGTQLRPGMFARPRVVFSVREGAVVVPEEALVPQGTRQFLFKVVDGPDGKKVSQRVEAKVGLRIPGKAEILEGVKGGDLVVTAGQGRLARGDNVPVRPIELGRPAGPRPSAPGGAASAPRAGSAGGGSGAMRAAPQT